MLNVDSLAINGRHAPLLKPTSLTVHRGELLLAQAEPQLTRTALALGLTARMRPHSGTVAWNGDSALAAVRKISALVDSPEINAPEPHLKVRDLVAEDLAMHPGPFWRRSTVTRWMERHQLSDLSEQWLDAIDPLDRLHLLTHLALESSESELLVFDSPDRHGIPAEAWLNYLAEVTAGRRHPAVIAIVSRIPENYSGLVARAGDTNPALALEA